MFYIFFLVEYNARTIILVGHKTASATNTVSQSSYRPYHQQSLGPIKPFLYWCVLWENPICRRPIVDLRTRTRGGVSDGRSGPTCLARFTELGFGKTFPTGFFSLETFSEPVFFFSLYFFFIIFCFFFCLGLKNVLNFQKMLCIFKKTSGFFKECLGFSKSVVQIGNIILLFRKKMNFQKMFQVYKTNSENVLLF